MLWLYARQDPQPGMCSGTVHAMFSGTWDEAFLRENLGDNLGCAVLPSFVINETKRPMLSFSSYEAVGINPYSENIKVAAELAAFLASPESQIVRWNTGGVIPAAEVCAEDPAIRRDPVALTVIYQSAGHAVVQPSIAPMQGYWDPMTRFGERLMSGYIDYVGVVHALQDTMQQINGG